MALQYTVPSTASVTETAALIMRCIAQDGAAAAAPMREGALSEGALLHHLLGALGTVRCVCCDDDTALHIDAPCTYTTLHIDAPCT